MKRRILSIVTALALCLSLCPTWAFAVEPEPDTGLCAHNTDDCRICPIEALIAALPGAVTADNRAEVEAQLQEILDLYRELSGEEQEQIDMTLCSDLLAALDEANAPLEVTSIPQKAKNSEGTMLEVGLFSRKQTRQKAGYFH